MGRPCPLAHWAWPKWRPWRTWSTHKVGLPLKKAHLYLPHFSLSLSNPSSLCLSLDRLCPGSFAGRFRRTPAVFAVALTTKRIPSLLSIDPSVWFPWSLPLSSIPWVLGDLGSRWLVAGVLRRRGWTSGVTSGTPWCGGAPGWHLCAVVPLGRCLFARVPALVGVVVLRRLIALSCITWMAVVDRTATAVWLCVCYGSRSSSELFFFLSYLSILLVVVMDVCGVALLLWWLLGVYTYALICDLGLCDVDYMLFKGFRLCTCVFEVLWAPVMC